MIRVKCKMEKDKCSAEAKFRQRRGGMGIMGFLIIVSVSISSAQNSKIAWSSFSNGFGVSSSGNTSVTSSAGIPFAGSGANGSSGIVSGFLTNYSLILTDVENLQEEIPTVYKLNQNYPNPFNPSTIINYQIPEEGFVTLKVYDILGKEVQILVNENKQAGSYNIIFNASSAEGGLASGIYIYQIRVSNPASGGYTASKKLMLVK